MGVDSLMTQLAKCCKPAPPDEIGGFVTRGKGITVHRVLHKNTIRDFLFRAKLPMTEDAQADLDAAGFPLMEPEQMLEHARTEAARTLAEATTRHDEEAATLRRQLLDEAAQAAFERMIAVSVPLGARRSVLATLLAGMAVYHPLHLALGW